MRHVFNNSMVAHLWANQSQGSARNSAGTFRFDGVNLWSFRTIIATIATAVDGSRVALFAETNYSRETSCQLSHSLDAWSGHGESFRVPLFTGTGRDLSLRECHPAPQNPNDIGQVRAAQLAYLVAEYHKRVATALRARSAPYTMPDGSLVYGSEADTTWGADARRFAELFNLPAPDIDEAADTAKIRARFERLAAMQASPTYQAKQARAAERREQAKERAKIAQRDESRRYFDTIAEREPDEYRRIVERAAMDHAQREKWRREREEREAKERERRAGQLAKFERLGGIEAARERWRTHTTIDADAIVDRWSGDTLERLSLEVPMPDGRYSALLRLSADGASVETSQRAEVPADHARRLFATICKIRERNARLGDKATPIDIEDRAPLRVGHFQVSRIEINGDFKAGCHFITWDEVARFALRHGWDCGAEMSAAGFTSASPETAGEVAP